MQLKKKQDRSVRDALAAATCGLLGSAAPHAQALGTDSPWELDSAVLYYSEMDGRVSAVEPVFRVRKELDDDEYVNLKLVVDVLTGASPNGATASNQPQTFTRPSGTGTYTVEPGETPLDDTFKDTRVALSGQWEKPFGRLTKGIFGVNVSNEYDFFSYGANATLARDFNQRNTTLSAGVSFEQDNIDPVGGAPLPLATMEPAGQPQNKRGDDSKTVVDLLLGLTQVINRRTLMQFNYSLSHADGYLNDPYKVLSVIDDAPGPNQGEPVEYRFENRPDTRLKHIAYWKTAYHFDHDVVDFSYRFMLDDWGINSHTLDMHYRYRFGHSHRAYLQPHLRYYTQSAADFFTTSLVTSAVLPKEASADYRLGDLDSVTLGLKVGYALRTDQEIGVRFEYIRQMGNPSGGSEVGSQKDQDLFPDVDAFLVQLDYALDW